MATSVTTFQSGKPKTGGRKKGTPNKATREIREVAVGLLEDPDYQRRLRTRLLGGKLPPQIESLLFHYAYGKPRETVAVAANPSLAELLRLAHTLPDSEASGPGSGQD
jgi:hypothetical protein